jgi:hypothetical protein
MKKLLSLAFIVLGLTTASAFAQSTTVPSDTPQTQQQPATGKSGKKHQHKHKKGAHKGHKKSKEQNQDQPKTN